MNPADSYALLAILLLTLLNAFFTLAETALVTVRNARLQQMIARTEAQTGTSGGVPALMRQATRVGATAQVGITVGSFVVAALAAATLAPDVARFFHRRHVPHDMRAAVTLLTLGAALWTIVFGEIVPRAIARHSPLRVAALVQAPLRFFMFLLAPLAWVAMGLSNTLVRPFGLSATFTAPVLTEEELQALLEAGAQSGAIDKDEQQIIRNVISFGDTDVRQVMTPRINIKAGDVGMGLPALLHLVVESGHSRIPVFEGSVDVIIGIVHVKDLLPHLARGETEVDLRRVMRVPLLVPENKRVDELLDEFRCSNIQLAIVQDEYGGTAGLVTIEDLLEELVGEIQDEYDKPEADSPPIQWRDEKTALIDGRMPIDDLNEQLQFSLPHEDFDTVGGFVFGLFGRQPSEGELVDYQNLRFAVERSDGRRIQQVRLLLPLDEGDETGASLDSPP